MNSLLVLPVLLVLLVLLFGIYIYMLYACIHPFHSNILGSIHPPISPNMPMASSRFCWKAVVFSSHQLGWLKVQGKTNQIQWLFKLFCNSYGYNGWVSHMKSAQIIYFTPFLMQNIADNHIESPWKSPCNRSCYNLVTNWFYWFV